MFVGLRSSRAGAETADMKEVARGATLDFCATSEASARDTLHKARLLREIAADFTTAFETAVEDWRGLQS